MKQQYGLAPNWQQIENDNHPRLGKAEIHLWWLPLTLSKSQQEAALLLLSDKQRDRYNRRKSKVRQQSYLAGRYYLLTLLSQYTETPPDEILLSYTSLDKPFLTNREHDIEFNFTDTNIQHRSSDNTGDHYGLFAFCKNHAIGVDIESLERKANFLAISESRFSQSEQQFVKDSSGNINPQRCLAIWTRKEAFGKAVGRGINYNMNALDLSSAENNELNFSSHDDDWRLTQIQLTDTVISCVAHQGHQVLDIKAFNCVNHLP